VDELRYLCVVDAAVGDGRAGAKEGNENENYPWFMLVKLRLHWL
jgi:hypothetical protein